MKQHHAIKTLAVLLATVQVVSGQAPAEEPPQPPSPQTAPQVMELMGRVADWQMHNEDKSPFTDWVKGAMSIGLLHYGRVAADSRVLDYLRAQGERVKYDLGKHKRYYADDQCIGQTWLSLYQIDGDPNQFLPTKAVMDDQVTRSTARGSMVHIRENYLQRWTWCDALFMAPPVLAKMYALTGNTAYRDVLVRDYMQTTDFLFDKEENLFFRDASYFKRREANGEKMFWSRGNGWVFAGLALVLDDLPQDDPYRPYFEDLYRKMAGKLVAVQQMDGSWHASLLDPASYPVPETSGTAFFVFGLAWGINQGLLDEATYLESVNRGWALLASHVQPDGMVGYVQPIGEAPRRVTSEMTAPYGVGGVLLAGTQVWEMRLRQAHGNTRVDRVMARRVPERHDDFVFENDLVIGRFYGPNLAAEKARGGLDIWVKNTPQLVADAWYEKADYHTNHGQGGDFYAVGDSLGAGGLGYLDQKGELIVSPVYESARVLYRSHDAVVFELLYPAVTVGGARIRETRRVRLVAGDPVIRLSSNFQVDGQARGVQVVAGLVGAEGSETTLGSGGIVQQQPLEGGNGQLTLTLESPFEAAVIQVQGHSLLPVGNLQDGATWYVQSRWQEPGATPLSR